jgi:hypothetical protein
MGVTDGLTQLAAAQAATRNGATRNTSSELEVMFDPKGKLLLPETPASDDTGGLCKWLTCVFNLDHTHPVTQGTRLGVRGPDGQAVLDRRDAPSLRFEPVRVLNNPTRLIEALSWQKLTSDSTIHGLKADHCRLISHVVVMLCGAHQGLTEAQETEGILGDLVQAGIAVDDHTTYGHGGQSYEAAVALRRELDKPQDAEPDRHATSSTSTPANTSSPPAT